MNIKTHLHVVFVGFVFRKKAQGYADWNVNVVQKVYFCIIQYGNYFIFQDC